MVVKNNLRLIIEYLKINFSAAMEYRVSFITQALFMMFNDAIWIIFWLLFFNRFVSVNSWGFKDIMFLYAVVDTAWGLIGTLFGNFQRIADTIIAGQLDFYLALPREELTHLLISKSKWSAFGDLIFGLIIAIIFVPLVKWPLFLALVVLSGLIMLGFSIILGSLSFYIGSAKEIADTGIMSMLTIASYPFSSFGGLSRIILLTIIPAGFVSGIPVELMRSFSLEWFLLMIVATITIWAIAIILFKFGLKKYESGNLIAARI